MRQLISINRPGDKLPIRIWRDGEQHDFEVVLADLIASTAAMEREGLAFTRFGVTKVGETGRGVVIVEVTSNSPAVAAGLAPDMTITALEDEPVTGWSAFRVALAELGFASGKPVKVQVRTRDGESKSLVPASTSRSRHHERKNSFSRGARNARFDHVRLILQRAVLGAGDLRRDRGHAVTHPRRALAPVAHERRDLHIGPSSLRQRLAPLVILDDRHVVRQRVRTALSLDHAGIRRIMKMANAGACTSCMKSLTASPRRPAASLRCNCSVKSSGVGVRALSTISGGSYSANLVNAAPLRAASSASTAPDDAPKGERRTPRHLDQRPDVLDLARHGVRAAIPALPRARAGRT